MRLWEVSTGRCCAVLDVGGQVTAVEWSPNPLLNILAVTQGSRLLLLQPGLTSRASCAAADELLTPKDQATDGSDKVRWEYHGRQGTTNLPQLRWTLHHAKVGGPRAVTPADKTTRMRCVAAVKYLLRMFCFA